MELTMNGLTTLTLVTGSTVTIPVPAELLYRQVEVTIVPVEESGDWRDLPPNGTAVAALLQELATAGGVQSIEDPVVWQREQRRDRPLPGRERQ